MPAVVCGAHARPNPLTLQAFYGCFHPGNPARGIDLGSGDHSFSETRKSEGEPQRAVFSLPIITRQTAELLPRSLPRDQQSLSFRLMETWMDKSRRLERVGISLGLHVVPWHELGD